MTGDVLVLNAGSSSIKVSLFAPGADGPQLRLAGQIEGIGTHPHATAHSPAKDVLLDQRWPDGGGPRNHDEAMALIVQWLSERLPAWTPAAVGHRVVHGGTLYQQPVVIDAAVRANLESLVSLAPLHQPHNVKGIDAAGQGVSHRAAGRLLRHRVSSGTPVGRRHLCVAPEMVRRRHSPLRVSRPVLRLHRPGHAAHRPGGGARAHDRRASRQRRQPVRPPRRTQPRVHHGLHRAGRAAHGHALRPDRSRGVALSLRRPADDRRGRDGAAISRIGIARPVRPQFRHARSAGQ